MRKLLLKLISLSLAAMAAVSLQLPVGAAVYTVRSGDTLWKISRANGLTVTQLKQYSSQTNDTIYIGQKLSLAPAVKHIVKRGDTLWQLAQKHRTTVAALTAYNNLSGSTIYPGQLLYIPLKPTARAESVTSWPSVTYTVQAGDTVSGVAARFGVSQAQLLKHNYMTEGQWLNAGQKIAINGYAPRAYAVRPGESTAPARVGKLVDWYLDGQYLLKRNDVFTITDCKTGLGFQVKMVGGYNHSDVEPLKASDTAVMKKLFPDWVWTPRPVVIYHQGINFAASLSGMPHSFDSISANGVTGHFDLYLYNSKPHSATATTAYRQQHAAAVQVAAGR